MKRHNKSVRLFIISAEFHTESANCSARNPVIVRADIRGWLHSYMQITRAVESAEKVKFSVSCTVPPKGIATKKTTHAANPHLHEHSSHAAYKYRN